MCFRWKRERKYIYARSARVYSEIREHSPQCYANANMQTGSFRQASHTSCEAQTPAMQTRFVPQKKKKKSLTNLHDKRKDGVELSRQNYLC